MESENHMDGKFFNNEKTFIVEKWSIFKILKKMLTAENAIPKRNFDFQNQSIKNDFRNLNSDLKISWLGHSTILMEIDGVFILTDPVWGKRVSPISFAGPKRFFNPPVSVENLPDIDIVIISHDHYDHLDRHTIKILKDHRVGKYFVPHGLKNYLVKWGVSESKVKEFRWWESVRLEGGVRITATPSKHFSGRSMLGRNTTLWSSWVIERGDLRIFFSGDSGYTKDFKDIGDIFGPFDLVFMETGAYDDMWPDIHMGPENAVKAFRDLKGKTFFPIHWGTFKLASHSWDEPVEKIIELSRSEFKILAPKPGSVVSISDNNKRFWWRS